MEKLENVKFSRINFPKGVQREVEAGTWTVGTISTGKKEYSRGKFSQQTIQFKADNKVNTGIDLRAKYNIIGYYEDGKYGQQLIVQKMEMILDTKSVKGLGQALKLIMTDLMATRLIDHFGTPEAVIEAFENEYTNQFMEIKGMTEDKLVDYYYKYEKKISGQEAIMKLTPLGFTPKQAKSIYKRYQDIDKIMEILQDAGMYDFYLDGAIKFHEAEIVGREMNIDLLNIKRIGALMVAYYRQPFQDDSYLTDEQLTTFVIPYLINNCGDGLNQKHYNSAVSYLRHREATHRADNKTGLKIVHDTESGIYQTINSLNDKLKTAVTPSRTIIDNAITNAPFELSDEQIEAVNIACENGISIISGNAGAGKSTILKVITEVLTRCGYDIEQVALSGKAALRIKETTELTSQTIHRMFAMNTRPNEDGFKDVPDINNPYADLSEVGFYKDVLILDEASMVGGSIMLNLLRLMEKGNSLKHIIIVGDNAQLPPIGTGQVFTDLLNTSSLPKVKLSKVYRQASESGILATATMVRKHENFMPHMDDFGKDFKHMQGAKSQEIKDEFDRMLKNNNGDLHETQIIATTNLEVTQVSVGIQKHLNIFSIRSFKSKIYGVEFTIYEGSKVMLSENQYETLDEYGNESGEPVFNGNIGIVKRIYDDYMLIDFTGIGKIGILKENWIKLRLGYAITIHKSQGSGFNSVIAIVSDKVQEMLTSNMLYTAITRAKNECTLISRDFVIDRCVNNSASERQTWLPIFYGGNN